jgi:hypothetical protein
LNVSTASGTVHEYPFSEGQVWAEPDLAAAAEIMRSVAANPAEGRSRAAAGQALVNKQYGIDSVGPLMRARLSELLELRRKWS